MPLVALQQQSAAARLSAGSPAGPAQKLAMRLVLGRARAVAVVAPSSQQRSLQRLTAAALHKTSTTSILRHGQWIVVGATRPEREAAAREAVKVGRPWLLSGVDASAASSSSGAGDGDGGGGGGLGLDRPPLLSLREEQKQVMPYGAHVMASAMGAVALTATSAAEAARTALLLAAVVARLALGAGPSGLHATLETTRGLQFGVAKASGSSSDESRHAPKPPKLAISAKDKESSKLPSPPRPPSEKEDKTTRSAPKLNSARGAKKAAENNPLGGGSSSARGKPAEKKKEGGVSGGGVSEKGTQGTPRSAATSKPSVSLPPPQDGKPSSAAPPSGAGGGASAAAPAPSARAMPAPIAKSKGPPASKGAPETKKLELYLEPEVPKPAGLVYQPIPPLPASIKKPPGVPIISPAGTRPRGRQDGAPSRHDLAPTDRIGWALLFNCFKAKFEVRPSAPF